MNSFEFLFIFIYLDHGLESGDGKAYMQRSHWSQTVDHLSLLAATAFVSS